ncbi:hypothetical protein, partial [Moraxella catarrhalis]|uniref:hypothetical protein n=1 Tax=Moraxella catarrhalis TaxID=480 RepID=UPI001D0D9D1A
SAASIAESSRTSLDEEYGDMLEEASREDRIKEERRRSSGSTATFSSFHSNANGKYRSTHSRPGSFDWMAPTRRTASIESASSSPTVAQHNQFSFASSSDRAAHGRTESQEWARF